MTDYEKDIFLKELEVLSLQMEKDTLIDLILSQEELMKEYKKQIFLQHKLITILKGAN